MTPRKRSDGNARTWRLRPSGAALAAALGIVAFGAVSHAAGGGGPIPADSGPITGTVVTRAGDRFEGVLRWDENERYWSDEIDAAKDEWIDLGESYEDVEIFGLTVWRFKRDDRTRPSLSIPFSELARIEPDGDRTATLTFRDGRSLRGIGIGTDLGGAMRGLEVADGEAGSRTFEWRGIERVELGDPRPARSEDGRIYGVVSTSAGAFEGFVVWDNDETELDERLDGDDDEVAFADIARIVKTSDTGVRVTRTDGSTVELSGTNDVDSSNRGIIVRVVRLGRVEVAWDAFQSFERREPPRAPVPVPQHVAAGLRELRARVSTVDGRSLAGRIVWDRDERYYWETIDGEDGAIDYAVPFREIATLVREDAGRTKVVLRDGRELTLSGTNDVTDGNRGVVLVPDEGGPVELEPSSIERVEVVPLEPAS